MKENFDFNKIGKRMPYRVPEGAMDRMEERVWATLQTEMTAPRPKRIFRLWYAVAGGLVAASVALLLLFNFSPVVNPADEAYRLEQAFCQLSSEDQENLLALYSEDPLMMDDFYLPEEAYLSEESYKEYAVDDSADAYMN